MIDNFNNILMPLSANNKLSGSSEQAANFAALDNTSLEYGRLGDVMNNTPTKTKFNQMLQHKLTSVTSEPSNKSVLANNTDVVDEQDIANIVNEIYEQLNQLKSNAVKQASEDPEGDTLSLAELTKQLRAMVTHESPMGNELESGADVADKNQKNWQDILAEVDEQAMAVISTNLDELLAQQSSELTQDNSELAKDSSEQTQDSSELAINQSDSSQHARFVEADKNQLLANKLAKATPSQLEQLALLSGISVEQLNKLALNEQPQATTAELNSPAVMAPEESVDNLPIGQLITKLEQLIKPLANNQQLSAELGRIKQAIEVQVMSAQGMSEQGLAEQTMAEQTMAELDMAKQDLAAATRDIEQAIEQRVNQPISELINQVAQSDLLKSDLVKSDLVSDKPGDNKEIIQQIKSLVDQLPPNTQQQLKAALNASTVSASAANAANDSSVKDSSVKDSLVKDSSGKDSSGKDNSVNNSAVNVTVLTETEQAIANAQSAELVGRDLASISAAVTIALEESRSRSALRDQANTSSGAAALSGLSAAAMVSNQVNLDAKKQELDQQELNQQDNQDNVEFDEQSPEFTLPQEDELAVKSQGNESIERLLKQFEARNGAAATSSNAASAAELASIAAQELDSEQTQALAQKEPTAAQKIAAEQLVTKLPLGQDAQAARVLKEQLSMMVKGDVQQAIIQLDPEELGGMSIRLQLQNDQMSVQFQVQNAQAKEMLENAMNKLKEMLEEQGIVLADSDVEHKDSSEQQEQQTNQQRVTGQEHEFESDQDVVVLTLNKQSADGIDYYA